MKIAIYTRKSKYSDKSESIDSQIEYCKHCAKMRYPDIDQFEIYVDEGFSGGNTNRPQYTKFLNEVKNKEFVALICYKIDRVSRSFVDFANLQQYLAKYEVNIISASEGFDTSSVWGQSVLNILMVFAQLERSNVSERVRDTMLHYAKQGRWTGGLTPMGFESKSITYDDAFGQEKKMTVLMAIETEIEIIKLIYSKYLELQSLNAVETYLTQNNIKTRKDCYYSVSTIRDILINPVYAVADKDLFNFFISKGAEVCNNEKDFDGTFSVLPYNREDKKKLVSRPINEWIIAISKHRGSVTGADWVKVQLLLEFNGVKKPRLGTAQYGVFSSLIKCTCCGSNMRIKNGRTRKDSSYNEFYYVCSLKEASHREKCDVKNLIGHVAEPIILEQIRTYAKDGELFQQKILENKLKHSNAENRKDLLLAKYKEELSQKEATVKNLIGQLSQISDLSLGKIVISQLEPLAHETDVLKEKISVLSLELAEEKSIEMDYTALQEALSQINFIDKISDTKVKRKLMQLIIDGMEWDGKTLSIALKTGDNINFNSLIDKGDFSIANLQTFHSDRKSCSFISRP